MPVNVNIEDIIKINIERNATLDAEFDPLSGVGSLIPRRKIEYSIKGGMISYMAPETMFSEEIISALVEHESVEAFLDSMGNDFVLSVNEIEKALFNIRLKHDFEFYCYTCVLIPEKIQGENSTGDLIPFKLNRSQRKLISKFEMMRWKKIPIRLILAKARQWGGSTATQIYMNWIQLLHKKGWNLAICTLVNSQASHIRNMLIRTVENFPGSVDKFTISNYANQATVKKINERDCIVGVGSTQSPENLRSYSIYMLHASEVSSWKDTPRTSAAALAQSLRGTIPNIPDTMVVLESTAKGVGNFFHKEWKKAESKQSSYDSFFVAWHDIEIYRKPIEDYNEFIKKLDGTYSTDGTTYWYLWEIGATLEGINWYMHHKSGENFDDLSMMQEFPSTVEESFSSTGRPAFSPIDIRKTEKNCIDPLYKGELAGMATSGEGALKNIVFNGNPSGNLSIWEMPDKSINVSDRYCGFADIGGKYRGADFSVVKIFDRYWLMYGGKLEVVAVWHGHIAQDLFAWKAAQLASWYNNALLAIEINSLKKENSEGDHYLTVLDEIAPYYDNLYTRSNPEKVRQGASNLYGYHTNRATKPLLVDTLGAALRDELYNERDRRATDEMYTFELKDNGTYGSKDGTHDDHVIVTAGGLWLGLKYLPLPVEVKPDSATKGKQVIGYATI